MKTRLLKLLTCMLLPLLALLLAPPTFAQSRLHDMGAKGYNGNVNLVRGLTGFNGDGNADVVVDFSGGANQLCAGDGAGGFSCSSFGASDNTNGVSLGDGTGAFNCSDLSTAAEQSRETQLADINDDGNLDVFVSNTSNQSNRLCLGDGTGGFTCSIATTGNKFSWGAAFGDFNGDTDLDAIITNNSQIDQVCLGDGTGNLSCTDIIGSPVTTKTHASLADLNSDGNLDSVIAAGIGDQNKLCLGDGAGNLACSNFDNCAASQSNATAIQDFDDDGNLDIYVACFAGLNRVCLGDGAGGFSCANDVIGNSNEVEAVPGAGTDIAPVPAAALYWPLDQATVNIDLINATDLLVVGGELAYDDTRITYDDGSLAAGVFLDDGSTILFEDDDDAGTLGFSVTCTSGSGASGSGTAATMTFSVIDEAPAGTANFSLSDLLAVDPLGNPITLTPTGGSFEIGGVWPGDTDNNCTAEAADLDGTERGGLHAQGCRARHLRHWCAGGNRSGGGRYDGCAVRVVAQ